MLAVAIVAMAYAMVVPTIDPADGAATPPCGSLSGDVTDASTGAPLQGAQVTLKYHDITSTCLTGADGGYRFDGVPICFCLKDLSASKDGYKEVEMQVSVGEGTVQDIALDPNGDGQGPKGGTLTGTVTDAETGEPIEGAEVTLDCHGTTRTVLTDANGTYRFTDVPLCFCLKNLSASKDGYVEEVMQVAIGEETVQDVELEPVEDGTGHDSGVVTGIVSDSSTGKPIEGATVTIEHDGTTRTAQTDADGRYTFTGVPECFCLKHVSVEKAGFKGQSKDVGVYGTTIVDFDLVPTDDHGSDGPAVDDGTGAGDGSTGSERGIEDGATEVAATGILGAALLTLAVFLLMARRRGEDKAIGP
jgi:hypothetical protein